MSLSDVRRLAFVPLLSLGLFITVSSYTASFISVQLTQQGYDAITVGGVHSAYYAGMVMGSLSVAHLIRRLGYLTSFIVFVLVFGCLLIAQGIWQEPLIWRPLRFGAGYSMSGVYVAVESWLLGCSTPQTRGLFLASYSVVLYTAQTFSQLFYSMIGDFPWLTFTLTPLLIGLSVLPAYINKAPVPLFPVTEAKENKMPGKLNLSWHCFSHFLNKNLMSWQGCAYGALLCFISGLIMSAANAFTPTFGLSLGYAGSTLMIPLILGGMLLQWPMTRFVERRTSFAATALLCITSTALTGLLTYIEWVKWMGFCVFFFIGGLSFALYPIGINGMKEELNKNNWVTVASRALFAYGVGAVLGPMVTARVIEVGGQIGMLKVITIETLFLSAVCIFLWRLHSIGARKGTE